MAARWRNPGRGRERRGNSEDLKRRRGIPSPEAPYFVSELQPKLFGWTEDEIATGGREGAGGGAVL